MKYNKAFKPYLMSICMRSRMLKNALVATAFASLSLFGAEKAEIQALRNRVESQALLDFVLLDSPQIEGVQIHHVIDTNKDGIIQAPDEIKRIYLDSSLKYNLHIKEPIAPFGELRVFVPQHEYWGTSIDVTLTQYAKNRPISNTRTNLVDLAHINDTNSERGKPQGVVIIPLDKYRRNYEQVKESASTDKITYYLEIMGKNGASHFCSYTLDFSSKTDKTSNESIVKK